MTCFRVEAPAFSIRLFPEWIQGDLRDRLVQNGSARSPALSWVQSRIPAPLAQGPVGQVVTGPQDMLEAAPLGAGPWPLHIPGGNSFTPQHNCISSPGHRGWWEPACPQL